MFPTLFSAALLFVTLVCALKALGRWRNPDNWHIDGETKRVVFHRWLDIGIFGAIGTLCLMFGLLGLGFWP